MNFGSCTWPPFMAKLEKFKQIICDFSDKADFVIVYIEEAHAAEKGHFQGL